MAPSDMRQQPALEEMNVAIGAMEKRIMLASTAMPVLRADAANLEEERVYNEFRLKGLEESISQLKNRLREVQALLDTREAEAYETEEAVRTFESRGEARRRELGTTGNQLEAVECGMRRRQRELLRLERTRDGEATAIWWQSQSQSQQRQKLLDEGGDAAALALRAVPRHGLDDGHGSSGAAANADAAEFAQFHSLALGVKLSLAGRPQLQNLTVQELWDEVRKERLPRAEWQAFLRRRLLVHAKPKFNGFLGSI